MAALLPTAKVYLQKQAPQLNVREYFSGIFLNNRTNNPFFSKRNQRPNIMGLLMEGNFSG
jgi:hypothetical protein